LSGYLDQLPFPILIGDIGGTNARFALIDNPNAPVRRLPNVHTADFVTIDDAIEDAVVGKAGTRPKAAVLALAGPITGDEVPLTNCDWVVRPKVLIARFGIAEVVLLNDFEAQSLGLPELSPADVDMVGDGVIENGARVVIGPGTGLGAGALVLSRGMWIPIPGEGGHVGLGPVTQRDLEVWPHIERHGPRVSAETVLCGAGMVRLYKAVCASDGVQPRFDTPAEITANGLSGDDGQAKETLALFAEHLGRVAGDTALVFMARGGVYLAGGITARIAPVVKAGGFRAAFIDKWPHGKLMERIATAIITKEDAALAGIAAFARTPSRYGVEVGGRRWQG
jgi:glucokinase